MLRILQHEYIQKVHLQDYRVPFSIRENTLQLLLLLFIEALKIAPYNYLHSSTKANAYGFLTVICLEFGKQMNL